MNNSRANACCPWKCKHAAARTARWTARTAEMRGFHFFTSIYCIIVSRYMLWVRFHQAATHAKRFCSCKLLICVYFLAGPPPDYPCFRLCFKAEVEVRVCSRKEPRSVLESRGKIREKVCSAQWFGHGRLCGQWLVTLSAAEARPAR